MVNRPVILRAEKSVVHEKCAFFAGDVPDAVKNVYPVVACGLAHHVRNVRQIDIATCALTPRLEHVFFSP